MAPCVPHCSGTRPPGRRVEVESRAPKARRTAPAKPLEATEHAGKLDNPEQQIKAVSRPLPVAAVASTAVATTATILANTNGPAESPPTVLGKTNEPAGSPPAILDNTNGPARSPPAILDVSPE